MSGSLTIVQAMRRRRLSNNCTPVAGSLCLGFGPEERLSAGGVLVWHSGQMADPLAAAGLVALVQALTVSLEPTRGCV